jgi:hypothetical protein
MSMEDAERHVGNGRAVYKSLKIDGPVATRLGGLWPNAQNGIALRSWPMS